MRIGIGHDIHRLAPGLPLKLGGVDLDHDMGLVGHSDADVLLHAVIDALLGAAGLDDIGQMFPNTDPANRGRDSAEMLSQAATAVAKVGWQVGNLDCVVRAERPKLSPHKLEMRRRIAEILNVQTDQVGLKAKDG